MGYSKRLFDIVFLASLINEAACMDSAMIGIIASSSCAGLLFIIIIVVAIIAATWDDCYNEQYMARQKRMADRYGGSSMTGSDVISLHRTRAGPPHPWIENGFPPPPGVHYYHPDERIEHEFYINPGDAPYSRHGEYMSTGVLVTEIEDERSSRHHNHSNRVSAGTYQSPRHSQNAQRDSQSVNTLQRDSQPMNTLQRNSHSMNTLPTQRESQPMGTLQRDSQSANTTHHQSTSNLSQGHQDHPYSHQNMGYVVDSMDNTDNTDEKVTSF